MHYSCGVKESAGTILYRHRDGVLEVLLVHPSGRYNARKPWSIPKGKAEPGESWEQAARRETMEEAGVAAGELTDVGHIEYRSRYKRIYGFAGPAPADAAPVCASWEVDRSEFVDTGRARELLHPDQLPFIDRVEALVGDD